jgi:hypothetical protein
VKSLLQLVLVALAKGLALLVLLYGYVNLNVREIYAAPSSDLYSFLEWRIGLLLVGYYLLYTLLTRGHTTKKGLAFLFLSYVLTLTILSPIYAFVLLINYFRQMTILHLCLMVVLVEYTVNWLLSRRALSHRISP